MNDAALNPRAVIGGNLPPEPTPYERAEQEISDLYIEASAWLDGKPVTSQEQADGLSNLLNMIRAARAKADEARKVEKKPHDDAADEVQARYKPILADADIAAATCKKALEPWLERVEAEQAAEAERARSEAEHARQLAQEAFQSSEVTNLADRARAERLANEAARADRIARRAEKVTPQAGNFGRSVGLRKAYHAALVDETTAAKHYWGVARPEMIIFLQQMADQDVRLGKREIPGFRIDEVKQAV